jgi:hypothetical protein
MSKSSFRNTLCKVAGAAALALSSSAAMANHVPGIGFGNQSFTINPGALGLAGCGGSTCTANFIDFSYGAEVDQTASGPGAAVFTETGGGFFGTFRTSLTGPSVKGTGLDNSYSMYFLFSAAGDTAPNGAGVVGTFTSFNYSIWIDKNFDTELTGLSDAPGNQSVGTTGSSDDVEVLTGTLLPGYGGFHIFAGLAAGDFNVLATATAKNGFFGGEAFSNAGGTLADINGVNSQITGIPTGNPFGNATDILIIGSGNTSFEPNPVPEPGSLALFGLALAGVAYSRRKKA